MSRRTRRVFTKLDYIIANFHVSGYKNGGKKKNTEAIINAIKNGKINIISHPHVADIPVDNIKVYEKACKNKVLLELNLSHLAPNKIKKETIFKYKELVAVVKKYKQKVIVGSDAHNIWELADDKQLKKIQKEIGLTDGMIINNYPKELFKLLKINEK